MINKLEESIFWHVDNTCFFWLYIVNSILLSWNGVLCGKKNNGQFYVEIDSLNKRSLQDVGKTFQFVPFQFSFGIYFCNSSAAKPFTKRIVSSQATQITNKMQHNWSFNEFRSKNLSKCFVMQQKQMIYKIVVKQ